MSTILEQPLVKRLEIMEIMEIIERIRIVGNLLIDDDIEECYKDECRYRLRYLRRNLASVMNNVRI